MAVYFKLLGTNWWLCVRLWYLALEVLQSCTNYWDILWSDIHPDVVPGMVSCWLWRRTLMSSAPCECYELYRAGEHQPPQGSSTARCHWHPSRAPTTQPSRRKPTVNPQRSPQMWVRFLSYYRFSYLRAETLAWGDSLRLSYWICFRKYKTVFAFSVISQNPDGAGCWNFHCGRQGSFYSTWLTLYVLNCSEGTKTYIYFLCHSSTLI